jgi:hypothetical protein
MGSDAPAGHLPAWGEAPLQAPPAFTPRNILRTIGPGVIGLGLAIGSGEWLLGPAVIVVHGPTLLWITTVAVVLQALLNLEMARYTLYTGEPIMTGYMRTWPGPKVWGSVYSVLTFLQYGWPSWSLASATATAALWLGRMPTAADASVVIAIGYITFGACFAIVLIGKRVERTIELAMWVMIGAVVLYLLTIDLATVSADNWKAVLAGFVRFGRMPAGADWALIGAFAAYSGLGGVGNAFVTNWMRDKGYGMAATVGYIPAAFNPDVRLSAHGNVFPVTAPALRLWREWWRFVNVDQWGIFAVGSIVGMALTALLTLQYVPLGSVLQPWAIANISAAGLGQVLGPAFLYATLVCGIWVLFKTQLGVVDGLPRAVTDILWSGSEKVRNWRGGDVRPVYYTVLAVFALWGCVALNLAQPLLLLKIGANIAGFNMVFVSLHTLYANRRFLPAELRPAVWREACLVMCGLFYGAFVLAAVMMSGWRD